MNEPEFRFRAAGVLGQGLLETLFLTVRSERIGYEAVRSLRSRGQPVIFVLWHDHLLPLAYYHRREQVTVLISEHTDGEYLARVVHRCGFETVRGSSTRGGVKGLKGLVRAARAGRDLALTPDGPRGPRHRFKPGAILVAKLTGLPIVPVAASADRAWRMDSWDRFLVPKPASKVTIAYGAPRTVPRDLDEGSTERLATELSGELDRLTSVVEVSEASK